MSKRYEDELEELAGSYMGQTDQQCGGKFWELCPFEGQLQTEIRDEMVMFKRVVYWKDILFCKRLFYNNL